MTLRTEIQDYESSFHTVISHTNVGVMRMYDHYTHAFIRNLLL